MSQTISPVAAKPSLLATVLTYFNSPADRNGLTAVAVSLITAISAAFGLTGTARITAIVVAVVFAGYGVARIVLPDNSAVKGDTALIDSEQAARDIVIAFATRNPAAFGAILTDAAKIVGDFTAPAPISLGAPAPLAATLAPPSAT